MSILALNATGEQRYLGPSSGSFFATYAASILRSCAPGQARIFSEQAGMRTATETSQEAVEIYIPLRPDTVRLLQRSYAMWIDPLYPLMSLHKLSDLIARCAKTQATYPTVPSGTAESVGEMIIFYLVMALGALNRTRTLSQLPPDALAELTPSTAATPSPAMLYSLAMELFQKVSANLQPSVSVIRILILVCIHSSQIPLGPSQWHSAGFAMRVSGHAWSCINQG
jgi:hypothetical protein